MTILETENLKKYYGEGDTQVRALDGVNLKIEEGEYNKYILENGNYFYLESDTIYQYLKENQ